MILNNAIVDCDPYNSCCWTSCHDDITFARTIISHVLETFCIDIDSIHMSGISNGGMFSYYAGKGDTTFMNMICEYLF